MARIAPQELERLKTDIDLVRLIESQGYQLQQHGKDHAILCPFHKDKTPSLIISPQKNVFNCFGCGERGTVIDWVMKTQGVSFRHAVEILQGGAQLKSSKPVKRSTTNKLEPVLQSDEGSQALLNRVIEYYHNTLKQNAEAQSYLKQRGLDHPELIDAFKLGYSNRTLGYRLPSRNSNAGKQQRQQLNHLGILRDSGHEHFNGCLVVPILDGQGNAQEVYGRRIKKIKDPDQHPKHYYLPGPHHGIFNASALKHHSVAPDVQSPATLAHPCASEIILCESLIDALTFWANGFKNVTSSYGTNGFTDDMLTAFKDNHIKRVYIAYDRDDAGNVAAEKLAVLLNEHGIDAFRVLLPKGMDANAYALQVQPAEKALSLVIRKAEWLGQGRRPKLETGNKRQENIKPSELEPENVSPQPLVLANDINADITDSEIKFNVSNRHYRVRGFDKNQSYDQLKINLMARRDDEVHSDTLDLYSAKHRTAFIKQAGIELGVDADLIKKDLGQLLLKLETLQEEKLKQDAQPKNTMVELGDDERDAALALLNDKNLLQRILSDFNTCGVIGEETNKLVGYLACVSRKLDKPLAVIIQSSSAAGKSSLMDAVLNLMPTEERIQYSAMTGQSLFYMGERDLKHKILAIAEEEGANQASYALKLLQSEGEITIASTGKDDATGNLVTKEYKVEGPVMLFLTTTAIDIDEELMNRCLVLTVNETREHTQAIHEQQRFDETLEGLLASEHKNELIELHRNAQRLLKPLKVVNPFAKHLTFLNDKTRTRRDHKKYLMLIRSIALLRQYQREIKKVTHQNKSVEYIEVTLDDIETANQLAHDVLGRTLDELPPQTRRLLKLLCEMVETACEVERIDAQDYRFSRRDVRRHTGWSQTQIRLHLDRLVEYEYLLVHGGYRGKSFVYELLYDGQVENAQSHMSGLLDVESLKKHSTSPNLAGSDAQLAGPKRVQNGTKSGHDRTTKKAEKPNHDNNLSLFPIETNEKASLNGKTNKRRTVASQC